MKPTIYFHIGQSKTGTSAIQGFLNHNRKTLAEEYKCLYPNFHADDLAYGALHNHTPVFNQAQENNDFSAVFKQFGKVIMYCKERDINKVIVSSEKLFPNRFMPSVIKKIIDLTEVDYKIVIYLRRQDKWLEAAWKQWGHKEHDFNNIHEYAQKYHMDWNLILKWWLQLFSLEHVIVRPYEKSQIGDDIIDDFLKIIGVTNRSGLINPLDKNINVNTGFSIDVIEILKLSKALLRNPHDNRLLNFMHTALSDDFKKIPMQDYAFLSQGERIEILQKYEPSNIEMAKTLYNREKFFNDPWPDENDAWEPYGDLTIEKLVPVFMEVFVHQYERIQRLSKKLSALK